MIQDILVISLVSGVLTSLIVWNLWGVHYLKAQIQKALGEKPKDKE